MTDLVRKQVREVMDEDRRINERVFQREKEQVKVFNETSIPKKGRDIDTEFTVERDVEKFNLLIEQKINYIEAYLKRRITPTTGDVVIKPKSKTKKQLKEEASKAIEEGDEETKGEEILQETKEEEEPKKSRNPSFPEYSEQLEKALIIGDVLISWNNLARLANRSDISGVSRQMISTKITESQNLIDAVVYAMKSLINDYLGRGINDVQASRILPKLVSAYSVYSTIQRQLYTGSIKPIDQGTIEATNRDVLADFNKNVRDKMDFFLTQTDPTKSILTDRAKQEALVKRIQILESEAGRGLSKDEIKKVAFSIMGVVPEVNYISKELQAELDRQARESHKTKREIEQLPQTFETLPVQAPTFYQYNPEFKAKVIDDINKDMVREMDFLSSLEAEYADLLNPTTDDPENFSEITNDFIDMYRKVVRDYRESQGMEPATDDEILSSMESKYPFVSHSVRREYRRSKQYSTQLRKFINEIQKMGMAILSKEREIKEAKALEQLNKPQVYGNGRSRFGGLGLDFDDRRNDAFYF